VTIPEEETVLDKGDAIYFEPAVDHSYRAAASPCAAIVVTVP
jgi:quercetin dioxygenase-like cupin family protein